MADFNTNVQPVQGQVAPVAPVQDNTAASAVSAVGGLLGGLGAAVINANTYGLQMEQQKYKARAMGEIQQNIMRVQDLQSQGVMSQDAALRRIRLTTASALANHPLLQDDINKLVGTLTGTALQKDISDGTQEEQDQHSNKQQFMKQAIADHYVNPNDPPEVQAKMAQVYQNVQLATAQLKQQTDVINAQKAQIELSNAKLSTISAQQGIASNNISMQRNRIALGQDIDKRNFLNNVTNLAQAYIPKSDKDSTDILHGKPITIGDKIMPTGTVQEKTLAIEAVYNNIQDTVSGVAMGADSTGTIPALSAIFDRRKKIFLDQISGKLSGDLAATELKAAQDTSNMALASKNPEFIKLTGMSKVLPAAANVVQGNLATMTVDMLRTNGGIPNADGTTSSQSANPTHGDPTQQKAVQDYSNILLENLKQSNAGKVVDPDHQAEINNNFNGMMNGFGVYAGTAKDATGLKVAVQTFAKPAFGLYASNPKNGFDSDASAKASAAYDQYYKTALLPLMQDEFLHGTVSIGRKPSDSATGKAKGLTSPDVREVDSQIHPEFGDGRVRFVPNDATNRSVVDKAKDLNNRVAPVLQTMIQADAHLHQSTNYEFYYNELMNTIQPPNDHGINPYSKGSSDVLKGVPVPSVGN